MKQLKQVPIWATAVIIVITAVLLLSRAEKHPAVSDMIGYVYAGQQLSLGNGLSASDSYNQEIAPFFALHTYRHLPGNPAPPVFGPPPGWPLLLAFFALISRNQAAVFFVNPALAALTLLALFWWGSQIDNNKWTGFWAVVILVVTPLFWTTGTDNGTVVSSMFFMVIGLAVLFWADSKSVFPYRTAGFVIAGLCLGLSMVIRLTNAVLLLFPLLLFALTTDLKRAIRDTAYWVFAGLLGTSLALLLWFNWRTWGGMLFSVYNTPALGAYPWSMFSWRYAFGPSPVNGYSVAAMMSTMWQNFSTFLLLVPVGLITMPRRFALVVGGFILSLFGLFAVYAFAATGVNSRFLLPVFPLMALAIGRSIVFVGQHIKASRLKTGGGIGLLCLLLLLLPTRVSTVQMRNEASEQMVTNLKNLIDPLPENALFISSQFNDPLIYFSDRSVLNYRRMWLADPLTRTFDTNYFAACFTGSLDALLAKGTPVYFLYETEWGIDQILQQYYTWEPQGQVAGVYHITGVSNAERNLNLADCLNSTQWQVQDH